VNLTVICGFLRGACEQIHCFFSSNRILNNYAEYIKWLLTKSSRPGLLKPEICGILVQTYLSSYHLKYGRNAIYF